VSTSVLRVGTRASRLALAQTGQMAERLRQAGHEVVIETISTRGDTRGDQPVAVLGNDGVFVRELERALLDRRIDVAVHSLKDMPTAPVDGLVIACVPSRATPFDAFVSHTHESLAALPSGAVVGTSSIRRVMQVAAVRPDLVIRPIRGNVDTRLGRLDAGDYDALVLAAAGLERLGFGDRVAALLEPPGFWPAVGQGALGLQVRADDDMAREAVAVLDDADTHLAVLAERSCLAQLAGGCLVPVAGFATIQAGQLRLGARVLEQRGHEIREISVEEVVVIQGVSPAEVRGLAENCGATVAEKLLDAGAGDMLARMRAMVASGAANQG
jgi:hydroxymethylbilane synthase